MVRRVLPFVILAVLLSGCQKKVDNVKSAIVVNGETISKEKVEQAAQMLHQSIIKAYPQKSLMAMNPVLYKSAAYQLVSNIVMIDEAKKRNISVDQVKVDSNFALIKKNFPDQAAFQRELTLAGQTEESMKKQIVDGLRLDSLLKIMVKQIDSVKESDCIAFFETNKDKYVSKPRSRVSQLMFPVDSSATADRKDKFKKSAESALQLIKSGKSIDDVVKKFASNGAIGGDAGFVQKGDLRPALEAVLDTLKTGQTSGLILTEVGFVILQKTEEEPPKSASYDQVKDHVKFMVDIKKKNDFMTSYVDSLIKKSKVVYNDTSLIPLPNDVMDSLLMKM